MEDCVFLVYSIRDSSILHQTEDRRSRIEDCRQTIEVEDCGLRLLFYSILYPPSSSLGAVPFATPLE